jgi:hypothetical protein
VAEPLKEDRSMKSQILCNHVLAFVMGLAVLAELTGCGRAKEHDTERTDG